MTTLERFWPLAQMKGAVTVDIAPRDPSPWTMLPQTRNRGRRARRPLTGGAPGLWYTLHPELGVSVRGPGPLGGADRSSPALAEHLVASRARLPLCDAVAALLRGDDTAARDALSVHEASADAAWLAGMLALRSGDLAAARSRLETALDGSEVLGNRYDALGVCLTITVPLTAAVTAHVGPCSAGTYLVLGAIAQQQGDCAAALMRFDRLTTLGTDDPVATLMLAELAQQAGQAEIHDGQLVRLTECTTNASPLHAALLVYRARALTRLSMPFKAIATYNEALRRRKDRPAALLHRIRYERALIHEALGWRARARRAFEQLHAMAPDFEDVAERIA